MDAGEKVSGGLIITGRDSSELLELADEILNQMARLVHLSIKIARHLARTLGRDHWDFACRQEGVDHSLIDIERFIGQHDIRFDLRQEHVSALKIMRLTASQEEGQRIAQRIDHEMDFCAQPAFAAPNRLVFTLFFWAPALCWRTHNGAVDHGVLVICVRCQNLEYPLPDATLGPTGEPRM